MTYLIRYSKDQKKKKNSQLRLKLFPQLRRQAFIAPIKDNQQNSLARFDVIVT
jgi:hypothetical protein